LGCTELSSVLLGGMMSKLLALCLILVSHFPATYSCRCKC